MSIAGVFQAVGTGAKYAAGSAVAGVVGAKVAESLVGTSLDKAIKAISQQLAKGAGQSLVSRSAAVRVEPFTLVDTRAMRLPYVKDALNIAQRLFTAYYMLGISSENTIGSIKVSKRLDRFAPDRDLMSATASFLSTESYHFGLPFVGEAAGLQRYSDYCSEATNPLSGDANTIKPNIDSKPATITSSAANKIIQDATNLAIGQIVDVTIKDGDATGTVQVMIRLRVMAMEPSNLVSTLSLGGEDNSAATRFRKFRVGELTLWNDLVRQQDRIDNYRRTVMSDKTGYFRKAHARKNKSLIATMLTGEPSVAEATSIAIITKETQLETEDRMNGRFSDFATRQRMFDDSMLMLLFVIDADHETVTIYTRDIEDYGVHTVKDLKGPSAGGGGNELSDIMKSYLEGRVPGRL